MSHLQCDAHCVSLSVSPSLCVTHCVSLIGAQSKKKAGEGVWHWDGMSDSEDECWKDHSDDEDEALKQKSKKEKARLSFSQFNDLLQVLDMCKRDEDLCIAALHRFKRIAPSGSQPFIDVSTLARAISKMAFVAEEPVGITVDLFYKDDSLLLNLLYAPRRSRLHSLCKVLTSLPLPLFLTPNQ